MKKTFHEIFSEISKETSRKRKIELLQENGRPEFQNLLAYTFDPNIKWLLPEGVPPFNPLPKHSDQELALRSEIRRLYLFVEGNTEAQRNLTDLRREQLFIGILEGIDPDDAKLLCGVKDRKLPYKGITRKLVSEAFPELSKNW